MCLWGAIAIVVMAVIVALSFIYLPLWGAALVLVALLVTLALSFKWIAGKVVERFFIGIFDMKSKALRDAEVVVHLVAPAAAPLRRRDLETVDEMDESEDEPHGVKGEAQSTVIRAYYTVEVTITPRTKPGNAFQLWDVDDLMLIPYDMKVTRNADDASDDDTCEISQVLDQQDGRYEELEQSKLEGRHRLEFLVGVKPGHKRLKFRYYFEAFGDIRLP